MLPTPPRGDAVSFEVFTVFMGSLCRVSHPAGLRGSMAHVGGESAVVESVVQGGAERGDERQALEGVGDGVAGLRGDARDIANGAGARAVGSADAFSDGEGPVDLAGLGFGFDDFDKHWRQSKHSSYSYTVIQ